MTPRIAAGSHLGRYEVRSLIGAGGMGEVYRARDTQIGRDVAIKVLPAGFTTNPDRLQRFEQEVQAAGSLNHPNVLIVHDVGTYDGSPYIVSELLEGETLRDLMSRGALTAKKAIEYAVQIAQGLAAAHEKGIVHRDLKPENIFITREGRAKIVDFGLAKLAPQGWEPEEPDAPTRGFTTGPGKILGTVGYMSPEQVRGEKGLDYRSDIFSFGAVLYEMLTGQRAFHGPSAVETMNAILAQEPHARAETSRIMNPALQRVLRHCLEKNARERYQSMRDLAFDLEMVSGVSDVFPAPPATPERARPKLRLWLAVGTAALVAAAAATAFFISRRSLSSTTAVYQKLTFRRGTIWSALFAPDGRTVVYSASWNGKPMETFSTSPDSTESRSLGLENAQVLAVSSKGEMAILLRRRHLHHHLSRGTLARLPLTGGAPREILDNVQQVDWSPEGANLAIVHAVGKRTLLEYPIDKVLYETDGWISYPRISPQGDKVAFFEHRVPEDNRGWVSIVDLQGNRKTLSGEWAAEEGLAWSPEGYEVWFTANKTGEANALYAVTLSGKLRVVATAPINLILHDISRKGEVLLSSDNEFSEFFGLAPGDTKERDFSWLDWGSIRDLSTDGRTLIFAHFGEKSGKNYSVYLRKLDGSPPVRLGDGSPWALSPDGKWVISIFAQPPELVLLPTGAGKPKTLERGGIGEYGLGAAWFPDGRRVLFLGREAGQALRCYVQDIERGPPHPITPEGVTGTSISPDGKYVIVADPQLKKYLYPIAGGAPRPILGLEQDDQVIGWSADGGSIYIFRNTELSVKVYRLARSSGRRELWKEVMPSDSTGIREFRSVLMTPDGKAYVYGLTRSISNLYLLAGLR